MKNLREKLFALISLLIIFSFLIYLPYAYLKGVRTDAEKLGNNRLYTSFKGRSFEKINTKINHLEIDLQNMILNRFPFYDETVSLINRSELAADKKLLYRFSNYIPVKSDNGIFYYDNIAQNRYYRLLSSNEKELKNSMHKASNYYNNYYKAAREAVPNVKMAVFAVPMTWRSGASFYPYDDFSIFSDFSSSLDPEIKSGILNIKDENTFNRYFFKTDHHWNIYGAYSGYLEICKLLNIKKPVEVKSFSRLPNVKFRGSMSRTLLSESYFDNFDMANFDLPSYNIKVNGAANPQGFTRKQEYLNGTFPDSIYENHYGNFYHADVALIEYDFGNLSGKGNLLLIADSLSNCIEPQIASHYNKTFVIDQRMYGKENPNWLKSFLKKHRIDQILILSTTNGIYNNYPGNIGLEEK